jgi:tetratricopeptide (TPR) repeat protein
MVADPSLTKNGATSEWRVILLGTPVNPSLIDASKRALLLDPNDWFQHYALGVRYEGTGKLQEAISEYQKAIEMSGTSKGVVALAHAYSAIGRKAEGDKTLHDLERKLKGTADSPYTMATIYCRPRRKRQSIRVPGESLFREIFRHVHISKL